MAHGYLSYQDNRGEGSFLGDVVKAVKNYLDNREKKEKVADMVAAKVIELNDQKALPQGQTPLLKGGNEKQIAEHHCKKCLVELHYRELFLEQ